MAGSAPAVGVVGASGAAGREVVRQLAERGFSYRELRFFGSARTAGTLLAEDAAHGRVEPLGPEAGRGLDVVFFAGGPALAREHAEVVGASGALVVDLSSAFRDHPGVPLVVPEVNGADAGARPLGIVACPSPTTVALAGVLAPLTARWPIRRVVAASYHGVASAGTRAIRSLSRETLDLLRGRSTRARGFPRELAFNCIPEIGALDATGMSGHERAAEHELARVLGKDAPSLLLTAVRVPMFMGLGLSLVIEMLEPVDLEAVTATLAAAPGLLLHAGGDYPTPREVGGSVATHVGRVRATPAEPDALALWVSMDSLTKGKATTAVAIAEIGLRHAAA